MGKTRIYIDLETTGLHPANGARIIEIAAIAYDKDWKQVVSFTELVHPGQAMFSNLWASEKIEISGILVSQLKEARSEDEVAADFHKFLDDLDSEVVLHSYNISFEERFLGLDPWNISMDQWGECVMIAAYNGMIRKKKSTKWPKLQEAAYHCSIDLEVRHRAYDDAYLASKIHRYFIEHR